jgi:hypothetical protein
VLPAPDAPAQEQAGSPKAPTSSSA